MIPTVKSSNVSLVFQQGPGEAMDMDFECIKIPLPTDILCGKNKICIKHEGSKNFRNIIESYTAKYQAATSRQAKMDITKEIFDRLQHRRFLKYNEETTMWETLHPLAVRDKIGHALRFSNRKGPSTIRKQVRRSASDAAASITRVSAVQSTMGSRSTGNIGATLTNGSRVENNISNAPRNEPPIRHHASASIPAFADLVQQMLNLEQNGSLLLQAVENNKKQLMQPSRPSFTFGGQSARSSFNLGSSFAFKFDETASNMNMHASPSKRNSILSQASFEDLSWMLQMPLMEMESDGQVYLVDQQNNV